MSTTEFKSSLKSNIVPSYLSPQQKSLWYDAKGDWKKAHDLIDHLKDDISAHVHAYLHRVEGDLWNAHYWYSRANQPIFTGSLNDEWSYLVDLYC